MLTEKEYNDFWETERPHGFGNPGIVSKPPYREYVLNEINLADYLDLFTGKQTYERIDGNVTIGTERFQVGDYPWTQTELNGAKSRCIKSISLAEASPPASAQMSFYNLFHERSEHFTTQVSGYEIKSGIKRDQLLALANAGFLLLDLFPFPISFTYALRESLNLLGVTDFFYGGNDNQASFSARIQDLRGKGILCSDVVGAHCPPLSTHYHLAGEIDSGVLPV